MRRCCLLPVVVFLLCLSAVAAKQETWVEVRSPHFVVVTNSSEKQGRKVADQFERMRSVFHAAFPKLQIDPSSPIIVLAIKDEKDFRTLEPQDYLAKGSLKLGGLFLGGPDKNYVLMRLDAEGEHPYSVIYHEYTHLLLAKAGEWMPLWLNEGLAEFYQNTDIHEKDAELGQPSGQNLLLLRQNHLLPLATLFAVDHTSPYYHEDNKGSIFYAESWALTHYLQMNDFQQKTRRIPEYSALLAKQVDPATAATQAFGDLKKLESALEDYVRQGSFKYFKMTTTTEVDDSAFKSRTLSANESDALRADFLAYNRRTSEARTLLDHVLQEDPKNVSALETMGFLAFHEGHIDEAQKWYAQAVKLDSQNFLAHYYFASIAMNGSDDDQQVEDSLRTAIRLNPSFAPSYDRLAVFLGMRHRQLDEAHMLGLQAISLDPANVGYRINVAHVLTEQEHAESAIAVLHAAAKVAKSPADVQAVENALLHAQQYQEARQRAAERQQRTEEEVKAGRGIVVVPARTGPSLLARHKPFVPSGPHRYVVGVLKGVRCEEPILALTVVSGAKTLAMQADNYYKLSFTALNFQPSSDLKPCVDLENRPAKVEYVESADKGETAQLISVELHK